MTIKYLCIAFAACVLLTACNSTPSTQQTTPTTTEAVENQTFGEAFEAKKPLDHQQLTNQLATQDSLAAQFTGTVEAVCQVKGCWMTIVSPDDANAEPVMVKFKDYGFFMPLDIAGRQVIMDGYAFREVTPVDELRHYAEDAGKSPEEIAAITEPEEEYKFLASGVILLGE